MKADRVTPGDAVREVFQSLGEAILVRWQAHSFDTTCFPAIAQAELRAADLAQRLGARDILELAALDRGDMASQQFETGFGDFQYVAYRHGRFYIEVLYWMHSTTTIHEHAFSGAFALLHGSSVQTTYAFEEHERVNPGLRIGHLVPLQVDLLSAGDVVPIRAGRGLIHAVFHLEDPTVSVVARTVQDDESLPQLDYCGAHVGYKNDMTPGEAKRIKAMRLLARYWPDDAWAALPRHVAGMSRDQKFWFMKALHREIERLDVGRRQAVQQAVGDDWTLFQLALREEVRLNGVARLREAIRSPAPRRLLALLLSVPTPADFRRAAAAHLPQGLGAAVHELLTEAGESADDAGMTLADLAAVVTAGDERAAAMLQSLSGRQTALAPVWSLLLQRLGSADVRNEASVTGR